MIVACAALFAGAAPGPGRRGGRGSAGPAARWWRFLQLGTAS